MKSKLRHNILFGACIGLLGIALSSFPLTLELEESVGLRWLFALRGEQRAPESAVLVGISRDSATAFGLSRDLDEWPRSLHADLIDRLAALGAAVIVLDIMFEAPSDVRNDDRLGDAISRAGNVILLERVETEDIALAGLEGASVLERRIPPIPEIGAGALGTAPFTLPTVPFRTSQFWAFGRGDSSTPNLPAIALQAYNLGHYERFLGLLRANLATGAVEHLPQSAAQVRAVGLQVTMRALRELFLANPALAIGLQTQLNDTDTQTPAEAAIRTLLDLYGGASSRFLSFYGAGGRVTTIPFHRALQDPLDAAWTKAVAGKAVFVGYSEPRQSEQRDMFLSVYSQRSGRSLSGVEIGATAFANLLTMTSIRPWSMPLHLLWVLCFGCIATLWLLRQSTPRAIPLALAIAIVYLGFVWYRFETASEWWPLVIPVLIQLPAALAITAFVNGRHLSQQRLRIQTALGYYVPDSVLSRLLRGGTRTDVDRQVVHGTCVFSDAENFTSLSERLEPQALGALIEDYYKTLGDAVKQHGGFVADVSGDSTVAIWPAFESHEESHLHACRAALAMVGAIEKFNREHAPHSLLTGFGLDSGEVLMGNMRLVQQYQYRAVGDIINTASRVQGLNRILGTRVLASQATVAGLAGIATRELGDFRLVGKSAPIRIYEVIGASLQSSDTMLFARGLQAFRSREWEAARQSFETLATRDIADGPSRFYVDQCAAHSRMQLADDWCGAIQIEVK
jgi:adenylate cyclase